MDLQTEIEAKDAAWEAVRRHLEEKRRPVEEAIRHYPPPIAGCDAHFNYLLEQRATLSRELVRLEAASRAAGTGPQSGRAVDAFLRSSTCIDPEDAARIRAGSRLPA